MYGMRARASGRRKARSYAPDYLVVGYTGLLFKPFDLRKENVMRLFDFGGLILFAFVASVFGYSVFTLERTAGPDGEIEKEKVVEQVKQDYDDVEEFFASGGTANHDRYNR